MTALAGVDLAVGEGEIISLVGSSGCGKSTLLELIAGLGHPDRGEIAIKGGVTAAARLASCAWMPQRDCLLPWLPALDNAALAARNQGRSRRAARAEADEMFRRVGLAGFERTMPDELSGGMRQRVAFLRTFLSGKALLLLDEPFASLDALTRGELQEWLLPLLREEGRSVILVTHDIEEALYLSDRVAVLSPRPARVSAWMAGLRDETGTRRHVVSAAAFNRRREQLSDLLQAGRNGNPDGDPE